MLPSYFVIGWMIARFTRTLLTGERWPMRPSNPPKEKEIDFMVWRARGLLSCIIFFVLITMIQAGIGLYLVHMQELMKSAPPVSPAYGGIPQLIASLGLLVAVLWGFRLLWLFIPLVILVPIRQFLKDIKGMMSSAYIIGVWLLSIVPVMAIMAILTSLLLAPGQTTIMEGASVSSFLILFIGTLGELIAQMAAVASLTYAFKDILMTYGAKPIFIEPKTPL